MDILRSFVLSLYSENFYASIAKTWKFKAHFFIALISLVYVASIGLTSGKQIIDTSLTMGEEIIQQLPLLKVENQKLISATGTLLREIKSTSLSLDDPIAILDLREEPTPAEHFNKHKSIALVITQSSFFIRTPSDRKSSSSSPEFTQQNLPLEQLEGKSISKDELSQQLTSSVRIFAISFLAVSICAIWCGASLWCLITSFASKTFLGDKQEFFLNYQFAISAAALTPVFYLALIKSALAVDIPFISFFYALTHFMFVRFGTKAAFGNNAKQSNVTELH